ncbi:MAG TPA: hypothetical protein PLY54_07775, partial [Ottowia sp.]|nr:hypothetical protein [Ottowia sp.]
MSNTPTADPLLRRLRPLLGAAVVALAASACGGDGAAVDDTTVRQAAARLDTLVPEWMARTGVPGV